MVTQEPRKNRQGAPRKIITDHQAFRFTHQRLQPSHLLYGQRQPVAHLNKVTIHCFLSSELLLRLVQGGFNTIIHLIRLPSYRNLFYTALNSLFIFLCSFSRLFLGANYKMNKKCYTASMEEVVNTLERKTYILHPVIVYMCKFIR